MKMRLRLASFLIPLVASTVVCAAPGAQRVEVDTDMGKIVLQLAPERAPITVRNFLTYVNEGFYSGTIFHRVIPGFMIQGGGFTADLKQKTTHAPIPLEARGGLSNDKYTIAMARTANPHSATAQFYINVSDNYFLNADQASDGYGYTVFGQVVSGTEVVDRIAGVKTGSRGFMENVPRKAVTIRSVKVLP